MLYFVWIFFSSLLFFNSYGILYKHIDHRSRCFQHYDVFVNDMQVNVLKPFWKNTGLCPGDPHQQDFKYLLSSDFKQNLFHIGSLPYEGITQVRIHWLLDLVHLSIDRNSNIAYNFTNLDELIFELWKNHLYPGFELMGNPSNYFNDFENRSQVYMWRDLVKTISKHYIDIYGIEYLMKWNFETWNEPDHHDFDKLNFTIQGFLNYYDSCSEGLKLADKHLKFGGPGGSCRIPTKGHSPICWALLEHCISGKNYFTGQKGNRLDFISFHKKGNGSSFDILDEERETIQYMRNIMRIPSYIPFFNNEADPLKNWILPLTWRADVTYAAMVTKIALSHIVEYYMKNMSGDIHLDLLSNDNAFLSYFPHQFTQRTLLARFQVNNTKTKYVEFIKKPVYAVFGLLSQLCPNILWTKIYKRGQPVSPVTEFGLVATHCLPDRDQIVILMYNSADTILSNETFDVDLILNFSASSFKISDGAKWIILKINNVKTNPYLIWVLLGSPSYPTIEQFSLMKETEEPRISGPWNIESLPPWKLHLQLLNPAVSMISICLTQKNLKMVEHLRFLKIRNNTLQITWTDKHNRCVLTYNVEYSFYLSGPYVQLNRRKVIFPSYWHACNKKGINFTIIGFYRVSAVNYWNTVGPFSVPIKFMG